MIVSGRKRIYKDGGDKKNLYLANSILKELDKRKGNLSEKVNKLLAKQLKVEL
jgi:hypothetical protein